MTVPMKGIIIAIAFLAFLAVPSGAIDRSVTFGLLERRAPLIHRQEVREVAQYMNIVEKTIKFGPQDKNISAIVISDQDARNGGTAYLDKGGPGEKLAWIRTRSQPDHGINITVLIYSMAPPHKNCMYINFGETLEYRRSRKRG